jgi:hypothetical protein
MIGSTLRTFLGLALVVVSGAGCAESLSQPFSQMKDQPIAIYRLQNFEPTPAAAATPPAQTALPPQIQQWITAGAAMLPPGLIPPGLLPGTAAPPAAASNVQRFHGFPILGSVAIMDPKLKSEVLDVFGHEKNFEAGHANCMYAEFGFSLGQASGPPADVLVSLSCEQTQAFGFQWPYAKSGLSADTSKRVIEVIRKSFGS